MKYSALKGFEDILPNSTPVWQRIESVAAGVFALYGYGEIRLPVLEPTDIFTRSIGETTDIVEKEMYTFTDRGGRSVTLRPEGTASAVRAYVEHNLHLLPSPQKFFYLGPMFRHERPQKGRLRQFHQIGAEAFGVSSASLDAEVLALLRHFFRKIGITSVSFEINSIGCAACRPSYREALNSFLDGKINEFCPDCQRRRTGNPLRILDCKVDRCRELRRGNPIITDFLCADCRTHFDDVKERIENLGIGYVVNPDLVRGLDYYTMTTFEVTSEHLGAQKAVAAGGRYDRLVGEFGGAQTPAIGFAVGMERLVTLLTGAGGFRQQNPDVFIAVLGRQAEIAGASLAENLRELGYRTEASYGGTSLKSQMRRADRIGTKYVFILGDDEIEGGILLWKNLLTGTRGEVSREECHTVLEQNR